MKPIYFKYLLLLLFITSCKTSKIETEKIATTNLKIELKPPFKNQGEQENYWAQEHFKQKYLRQKHSRFTGNITVQNDSIMNFNFSILRIVTNKNNYYINIFKNGLIYPQLLNRKDLGISSVEELDFLSDNPKVKRFRFWAWQNNSRNPQVYLFELTNTKTDNHTSFGDFCKGATLTYLKDGWIVI